MKQVFKRSLFVFSFLLLVLVLAGCVKRTTVYLKEGVQLLHKQEDAEGKVTWKRLEEKEVKETTKANKKLVERGFKAFVEIPKNGVVRVQYSEPNDSLLSKILLNGKEQKLTTVKETGVQTVEFKYGPRKVELQVEYKKFESDEARVNYVHDHFMWSKEKQEWQKLTKETVEGAIQKAKVNGTISYSVRGKKGVSVVLESSNQKVLSFEDNVLAVPYPGEAEVKTKVSAKLVFKGVTKAFFEEHEVTLKPLTKEELSGVLKDSLTESLGDMNFTSLNKEGKFPVSKNIVLPKELHYNSSKKYEKYDLKWEWVKGTAADGNIAITEGDSVIAKIKKGLVDENVKLKVTLTATVYGPANGSVSDTEPVEFLFDVKQSSLWSFEQLWLAVNEGEYENAPAEKRLQILAKLEEYLLKNHPKINLFSQTPRYAFSDRFQKLHDFQPLFGFGTRYSKLTDGDTFRSAINAVPSNILPYSTQDSAQSDALNYLVTEMFDFLPHKKGDKYVYELTNVWAEKLEPIDPVLDPVSGKNKAKKWKLKLREDVFWNPGTYSDGVVVKKGESIKAEDFLFGYKTLLTKDFGFSRSNLLYSGKFAIKNAKQFYDKKITEFEKVGVKATGTYELEFELERAISEFNFKYAFAPVDAAGPVHQELFKKVTTGFDSKYGSSADTFVSYGPYKLEKYDSEAKTAWFDKDKGYRVVRDQKHFLCKEGTYSDVPAMTIEHFDFKYSPSQATNWDLFEKGSLDQVSVPVSKLKDQAFVQKWKNKMFSTSTGTSWGLNVNIASQEELEQSGVKDYKTSPFLTNLNFRKALFHAINRKELAEGVYSGSVNPEISFFTSNYKTDGENIENSTYHDTAIYKNMIKGLGLDHESYGYSPTLAKHFMEEALKDPKFKEELGKTNKKISLTFEFFDGDVAKDLSAALKSQVEKALSGVGGVTVEVKSNQNKGLDIYYKKQIPGKYHLAFSGFSGGTLDPWNLLEVYLSSNRSGIFLNWGLDTSIEGQIEYDYDDDYFK